MLTGFELTSVHPWNLCDGQGDLSSEEPPVANQMNNEWNACGTVYFGSFCCPRVLPVTRNKTKNQERGQSQIQLAVGDRRFDSGTCVARTQSNRIRCHIVETPHNAQGVQWPRPRPAQSRISSMDVQSLSYLADLLSVHSTRLPCNGRIASPLEPDRG